MKRMIFSEFDINQMIKNRKTLFVLPVKSTHHKNHFDAADTGLTYVDFYDSNLKKKSKDHDMLICSDSNHWIGTLNVETGEWNHKPHYLVGEKVYVAANSKTTEQASQYHLLITNIKLKRVNDITEGEAFYNGNERLITSPAKYDEDGMTCIQRHGTSSYEESLKAQWQKKYSKTHYNWDNNPYVFIYIFELIHKETE